MNDTAMTQAPQPRTVLSRPVRQTATLTRGHISYLTAGPADGPLVVLVHGWPATAMTWTPQIEALASAGYAVVAPDMRGYGKTFVPQRSSAYALCHLVGDVQFLAEALDRTTAVWVGHDWGAAIVWALAAHHPEVCAGVAALVAPYRTLDRGLAAMLELVNRDVYPENQFPLGQFDYMALYEQAFEQVTAQFDSAPDRLVRAFYRAGDPAIVSGRSARSSVTKDGGWFGGAATLPDMPRDTSILTDAVYTDLVQTLTLNGFFGPNSYYLNHEDNRRYSDESFEDGYLSMPAMFIEAQFDPTADTVRSRLAEPMRKYCVELTEVSLRAGHWLGLEKPQEVNAALLRWLEGLSAPTRCS